jgi:hypothetical protein
LVRYPAYLAYQLPDPLILLLIPGIAALARRHRRVGVGLGVFWLVDVVFASAWLRQRQFLMMGVGMIPVAVVVGVGLASWARAPGRRRPAIALLIVGALAPPLVYATAPVVADRLGIDLVGARALPYRDGARYFLRPWKQGEDGAERYATQALAAAAPDGLIAADFTVARVLEYAQRQGTAPGVDVEETDRFIFSGGGERFARWLQGQLDQGRRVYLGDDQPEYYFIARLRESFVLEPDGVLVRVRARAGGVAFHPGIPYLLATHRMATTLAPG